ncbi:MAG: hypothetical protein GDA50_07375 [Alphaproteobacteria bacterium GM202ARS2]|nr:hypothetical protein [Alphaproteobacteria bacterium GM202ARS2]
MGIHNFKHKGLERLFVTGSKAGDGGEQAITPAFEGGRVGTWSLTVTGNWRLTFRFEGGNAFDVDFEDYH